MNHLRPILIVALIVGAVYPWPIPHFAQFHASEHQAARASRSSINARGPVTHRRSSAFELVLMIAKRT